jgi:hypothetical protein
VTPDAKEIKIRRWSKVVANTCLISSFALPALVLFGLYLSERVLPLWMSALGLLPVILFSVSMAAAYRCFASFAQGQWFSQHPATHLRKSGAYLVWASLAGILIPFLIKALATQNEISLSISSYQFQSLLFGSIIWVLGSVWQDAYLVAKENTEFV